MTIKNRPLLELLMSLHYFEQLPSPKINIETKLNELLDLILKGLDAWNGKSLGTRLDESSHGWFLSLNVTYEFT